MAQIQTKFGQPSIYRASSITLNDGQAAAIGVDVGGNVRTTLATLIAGEDLVNNVLVTGTNTIAQTITTSASVSSGNDYVSGAIAVAQYRKFRVAGAASGGNVDLTVQWSTDGLPSGTGWWYVNDQTSQYPGFATDVIAPFIRIRVSSASTQTVSIYLALSP